MKSIYVPKHFKAIELFPPDLVKAHNFDYLLMAFDVRILQFIDLLRDDLNKPIHINNGTTFTQRGLRTDINVGALLSQHRFGRALDFDVVGLTAEEVRVYILNHNDRYRPFITRLEPDRNWVHADCGNSTEEKIFYINMG